jgi:hypothetical protein
MLGALLLGEPLTWPILIGGAIVVMGVGLVVSAERPAGARRARSRGAPADDGQTGRDLDARERARRDRSGYYLADADLARAGADNSEGR